MTTTTTTEMIQFKLFQMECCGHMLCWVNPRFPSYCPQCGKGVYPQVRGWVIVSQRASLRIPAINRQPEVDSRGLLEGVISKGRVTGKVPPP